MNVTASSPLGIVAAFVGAVPAVVTRSRRHGGVELHFAAGNSVEFEPGDFQHMGAMKSKLLHARRHRPPRLSYEERAEVVAAMLALADQRTPAR